MSAPDRVLLLIYVLVSASVFAGTAALALGWDMPLEGVDFVLADGQRRIVVAACATVLLAMSLRLLALSVGRPRPRRALVRSTDLGESTIALSAIENVVSRVAGSITGVREADSRVSIRAERLHIEVSAWMSADVNIPDTAEKIQTQLEEFVGDTVGVEVGSVRVRVRDIGDRRRGRRRDM